MKELIIHLTKNDLKKVINESLEEYYQTLPKKPKELDLTEIHFDERLLGGSSPTELAWRRKGFLQVYRIGNSLRYNKDEVLESLSQVRNIRYRKEAKSWKK